MLIKRVHRGFACSKFLLNGTTLIAALTCKNQDRIVENIGIERKLRCRDLQIVGNGGCVRPLRLLCQAIYLSLVVFDCPL